MSTGSPDAVYIVFDSGGEVIVNDESNVFEIFESKQMRRKSVSKI